VPAQRHRERSRQHGDAIPAALAVAHDELAALERKILDPKAQRLAEAQAAAVEEIGDQPGRVLELRQQRPDLVTGQHHRQPLRAAGAGHIVQPGQLDPEYLAIKEQQRLQSLILRGGAYLAVHRQVGQELLHRGRAEPTWVAAIVELDVTAHPLQVGLLCPQS
jgi:hypothetical protein